MLSKNWATSILYVEVVLGFLKKCFAVNGNWSDWGGWGSCDSNTWKRKRRRQCNNPAPSNGGAQCYGSSTKEENCPGIRYCQAELRL